MGYAESCEGRFARRPTHRRIDLRMVPRLGGPGPGPVARPKRTAGTGTGKGAGAGAVGSDAPRRTVATRALTAADAAPFAASAPPWALRGWGSFSSLVAFGA